MNTPVLLPWERLLWQGRALPAGRTRYALTDVRLVIVGRDGRRGAGGKRNAGDDEDDAGRGGDGEDVLDELLIQDIGEIQRIETRLARAFGLSTIAVHARDVRRGPLMLRWIRHGAQLAAILELAAGEPSGALDAAAVRAALAWEPPAERHGIREAFIVLAAAFAAVFAVGVGLHGKAAGVNYASDDAIYPNGEKQDRQAIVRFMETSVLPWAREALGPIKGGADKVTCQTCHGKAPQDRGWRMPAVAALPLPDMAVRGWEMYSTGMDAQTRNAIYGYVAEADKQTKAAYMREVVMPGMSRLLHRPAYDFTKPYDYNRTRAAFGCYHCHQVS